MLKNTRTLYGKSVRLDVTDPVTEPPSEELLTALERGFALGKLGKRASLSGT